MRAKRDTATFSLSLPRERVGVRVEPAKRSSMPKHQILSARPRQLRRQMTIPERLLWSKLRNNALFGLKFRRQHPVGPFILDYYCAEHQLCVELDGMSHDGRAEADEERTDYLRKPGHPGDSVTNDDVLKHREAVLAISRGFAA